MVCIDLKFLFLCFILKFVVLLGLTGSYTQSRLPKPSSEVEEPELRPEYQTISRELRDLTKMVQDTLRGSDTTTQSDAGNPMFERGRFYEEYSARRNERLKRKRGESGVVANSILGLEWSQQRELWKSRNMRVRGR